MEWGGRRADDPEVSPLVKRKLTVFSIAVMSLGLLLWARLILVTGRPRMAVAQPQPKLQANPAEGAGEGGEGEAPSAAGERIGANDPSDMERLERLRSGDLTREP